ncbi:MAG: hypothetical protein H7146_09095 [Burkholderiaceae bacterium]|nr:hypothetical protein [Microbacteriaceae bacterium]
MPDAQTPALPAPARAQLPEKCYTDFPYLIPYQAEFDDELDYLNLVTVCWDGVDPASNSEAHYVVYNGSEVVLWLPEAAQVNGADGIDDIWTSERSRSTPADSEVFRLAADLDPTVDPVVLPGEIARMYGDYGWYVDYPMSVAWLTQTKIMQSVRDLKPKAYKRLFVGRSLQRKALVECVEAAVELGDSALLDGQYLTARELFSSTAGLASSGTQCANAWENVNGKAKVKNRFPSLTKGLKAWGSVPKYSEPTEDFLRILARAISAVK